MSEFKVGDRVLVDSPSRRDASWPKAGRVVEVQSERHWPYYVRVPGWLPIPVLRSASELSPAPSRVKDDPTLGVPCYCAKESSPLSTYVSSEGHYQEDE